ncbi:MAG: YceI family protein [Bacteroidales bacterium]|jgi:polyisoprenoid-binding protein YceI|nr:YceI family protein [Bacteroidales bacterium]
MKIDMKILAILTWILMIGYQGSAQTKWAIDNAHSGVKFTVSHLVISEVEGGFRSFTGNMTATKSDFTDAQIDFAVDVNSINTDNEMRDKHLKSDDFFNAEKFPKMTFKSVTFKETGEKQYELTGDLTIRDVTKRVKFQVTYGGSVKDPYGNLKAGFKATAVINRLDYGLKWNALTEAGGAVVGTDVTILINAEFAQQK